jgi:MYXO-CTERM domain-containing protein
MNQAGKWVFADLARQIHGVDGTGVMVGVADTGLDVTNPEMLDADGKSRVAWMLDLSLAPMGEHAALEKKFGIQGASGTVTAGAVLSKSMIDTMLAKIKDGSCTEIRGRKCAPSDEVGHGTHVTGIAAARGEGGHYPGIAPAADIVFVRVTRGDSGGIENDDLVRAVQFMFDRADAAKRPMVVNLSLGSDFGPHDGTLLWENVIANHVGANFPGRAIVAAAGNSGSIGETPIHQSVHVTKGSTLRVPIQTGGASASGTVQVWITLHDGADLNIGLDGPDGTWIAPVARGHQNGRNTDTYNAGVIYGAGLPDSPIPEASHGAVVVWAGQWPTGTYSITLEGSGTADLYLQGLGESAMGATGQALFAHGVRQGTINLPATHPSIIGVGCTVNRPRWTSIAGADVGLSAPLLDGPGGLLASPPHGGGRTGSRPLTEGEVCWFSSAGPSATGAPKPEIAAPGALVISALSRNATPGTQGSVFTNPSCPALKSGKADSRCLQIDEHHGIAVGTSMSSPLVAGVVALLLQKDPTLTQDKILALLQAGAHRFRGMAPFGDQSGPGEVDALGAIDALGQMKNPSLQLPSAPRSWITLSSDYVPADGSTPITAIVELRTADGSHRADFFDKGRLVPTVSVDGTPVETRPEIVRRGPGVWFFTWRVPAGLGGTRATFGATFDGAPIVASRTVPIATDGWTAAYPSHATGNSCNVATPTADSSGVWLIAIGGVFLARRRRSCYRSA